MKRDENIFEMYSLVIGVLAIIALLIFFGSMKRSDNSQDIDTEEYQAAVQGRIRPFGQVYMPGEEIAAEAPQVEEAPPAEPVETVLSGPQVYNEACLMCHGSGIGGAPVLSDAAAWEARIAQGNDVLYRHAIEGFTGELGFMPPKGARMDLSDDEVRAAVDYMIDEVSN